MIIRPKKNFQKLTKILIGFSITMSYAKNGKKIQNTNTGKKMTKKVKTTILKSRIKKLH